MNGIISKLFIAMMTLLLVALAGCNPTPPVEDPIYFVHSDHLNVPTVVTDKNKAVVWEGHRKPFGETEVTVATIEQPFRFPGQYYDSETGLHYNLMRDYDPRLGRYVQSDPIGLVGGLNTYGYAYQNPLAYTDPTGETAIAIPAGIGLLLGLTYCALMPDCWQNLSSAIDSIIQEARKKGGTRNDPVSLPIVNPGRDCNGNCNPCPEGAEWWVDAPGHGHENGYWHKIVYNQDQTTCTCYPDRPSRGLDGK